MMKVSELTSAQLDYWVAKAEQELGGKWHQEGDGSWARKGDIRIFRPSIHGEQGVEIIERERIELFAPGRAPEWAKWEARHALDGGLVCLESGPTALIAAMRAYVASKYGTYGSSVPDIPPQS